MMRGAFTVLLIVITSSPALADDVARAAFRDGVRALVDGDAAAACRAFETATSRVDSVAVSWNLGLCRRQLGQLVVARAHFARVAGSGDEALRQAAEIQLRQLDDEIASLRLFVNVPGARVELDGEVLPPAALAAAQSIDPGEHQLIVTADGHAHEVLSFTIDNREHRTVVVQLSPIPTRQRGAPDLSPTVRRAGRDVRHRAERFADEAGSSRLVRKWWFWTVVGVAVAGAAAASGVAIARSGGSGPVGPGTHVETCSMGCE